MKYIATPLIVILLVLSTIISAKTHIIDNPDFEVRTNGIFNVTKLELNEKEAKLHVYCSFFPKKWIQFSDSTFIQPTDTNDKLYIKAIEGTEIGKKTYMPESGDSSFVLIFPPLHKNIKKIDFGTKNDIMVYGLSTEKSKKNVEEKAEIPSNIREWINKELENAVVKAPISFSSPDFFKSNNARLIGYIKGYNSKLKLPAGIIYAQNVITKEDFPCVIEIHPDGRFETIIPLAYPQSLNARINNISIPVYLEQGQVLALILDWEDMLLKFKSDDGLLKNISYEGPLAGINTEFYFIKLEQYNKANLSKIITTKTPDEVKKEQDYILEKNLNKISSLTKANELSTKAATILNFNDQLRHGTYMLNYVSRKNNSYWADTTQNRYLAMPLPGNFYDFLTKIPLNEQSIMISDRFNIFINRFEFCAPFGNSWKIVMKKCSAKKSFLEFLVEDKNIKLSEEELELKAWSDSEKLIGNIQQKKETEEKGEKIKALHEKYEYLSEEYNDKYNKNLPKLTPSELEIEMWKVKDSILINELKLIPNFSYEICKVRRLKSAFNDLSKEDGEKLLAAINADIQNQHLKEQSQLLFDASYPEQKLAYELPDGKSTEIFRRIIDKHKGKILFVDFWAMWCGPCISSIKSLKDFREKHQGNPDFDFIFITDESGSPLNRYTQFVEEQGMANSYRINDDDFKHLRELFRFNGIPHYILIDRDGKVINNDFHMRNIETELDKILK